MRLPIVALCLAGIALAASRGSAQPGTSLCDMPSARGTAMYNKYCGACYPRCGNAGNSNNDNGAAAAAAAAWAEAAATAKRKRDAELAQQRIDAENQRLAEEAEKQAKFDQDKQDALGQLRGIANGGDFDSASGLKGPDSTSSSLKDAPDSSGLKTMNTDTSVVDLSDTNLADANKALMRHQWAMSIDQRYKDDPEVQQYIRDLWDTSSDHFAENMQHARAILTDQLRVSGLSQRQIDSLFTAIDTFTTGRGPAPKAWDNASTLAHQIDAIATIRTDPESQREYKDELVSTISKAQSIKATAIYMATGPQTTDDCVLHAISNGAQVPFPQVRALLAPTLKSLAIAQIEVRNTPDLAITAQDKGGTGGLNVFQEILIANKVGNTIGVPAQNFAKAIESTHRPVITSVGNHEVAVTGVYRATDGKVYYSVMDSNLKDRPNYTAYIEKNDFENQMLFDGGYVVVPAEKH